MEAGFVGGPLDAVNGAAVGLERCEGKGISFDADGTLGIL